MAIISGGQTLSTTNLTDLLDGGASTLHSHAASAAFPTTSISAMFGESTTQRFEITKATQSAGGAGLGGTYGPGLWCYTGSSNPGHGMVRYNMCKSGSLYDRKPTFRTNFRINPNGTDYTGFCGIGGSNIFHRQSGGAPNGAYYGHKSHLGFKFIRISSSSINLYATQGDNTTENASASLTTLTANYDTDVAFKVTAESGNNISSCDYYFSKVRADWSSAHELTSNGPRMDEVEESMAFAVGNNATTSDTFVIWITAELGG